MKVLIINSVCGIGSTGRICTDLAQQFIANGDEVKIAYGRKSPVPDRFRDIAVRIGTDTECRLHGLQTRLFDTHGFGSKHATREFLKWAEAYKPDLLWLHVIHGYYIHVEMLFAWIKRHPEMQVKWTMHDCWSFTGHCSHFVVTNCQQWKSHCLHCPELREYPTCYGRGSVRKNYERKRSAFTGVKNMTIITPCRWLAELVQQSFLKEYPVEVHYNTIDRKLFKPTPSDFRERYGLQEKRIVLGVSSVWDKTKGLNDFLKLAQMLDGRYAIVLVGLTDKQIRSIPRLIPGIHRVNPEREPAAVYAPTQPGQCTDAPCEAAAGMDDSVVIPQGVDALYEAITGCKWVERKCAAAKLVCIPRTNNRQELAAVYTAADVFANPTYEDTFPTVNLEARACGTRVVTYDTGGCRETLGLSGSACQEAEKERRR